MRVKRYIVDSMPDALRRIRSELGSDAVILNTKEIRSGGVFGFFGKKRIEVIAATDSSPMPAGASSGTKREAAAGAAASVSASTAVLEKETVPELTDPPQAKVPASLAKTAYSQTSAAFKPVLAKPEPIAPAAGRTPETRRYAEAEGGSEAGRPVEADRTAGPAPMKREDKLMEELKQVKIMMQQISLRQSEDARTWPAAFQPLFQRLAAQEVLPGVIADLIGTALAESDAPDKLDEDQARQLLRKAMAGLIARNGVSPLQRDIRVAHFVGPTGVGKTTTIAKLAAEQVLKHNRKVGFITSDTYRIAAVEQLKTYATILNVPLEVVFTPEETNRALNKLSNCDIIFMDTAGRNYRNEQYVAELGGLLNAGGSSETYLVLSLTSKYNDMKIIAEHFMSHRLDKVLFTKLDETSAYGAMLNLLHEFPMSLSYLTTGQNVPDDIELAGSDAMIDLILEGRTHE